MIKNLFNPTFVDVPELFLENNSDNVKDKNQ